MTLWLATVAAGFVGSFHCAAMCGPFVAYYGFAGSGRSAWAHVTYHLGRLCAYLGVGAVAGTMGQGFFYLGSVIQLQKLLIVLVGLAMIAMGISALIIPGKQFFPGALPRWIGGLIRHVGGDRRSPAAAAWLGLVTPLLPCGFLYSFAFVAGATGNPIRSGFTMMGFWLGTLPSLLMVGFGAGFLSHAAIKRVNRLTPVFLILFGLLAIWGKWVSMPANLGLEKELCVPAIIEPE